MKSRTALGCLLAGTILAAPAVAQTAGSQPQVPTGQSAPMQPGSAAMQPQTGTNSATLGTGTTTGIGTNQQMGDMRPIATPQAGQMLGSDLRGTRVYGVNEENVGNISDLVLDRDGRVAAVIVGVGGFLGIGQKDVAVPYGALEIQGDRRGQATAPVASGPGRTAANQTGSVGGTAGTAMTPSTAGGVATQGGGTTNPTRIVLRGMTKGDLEAAPAFNADGVANRAAGAAPR